MAKQVLIKRRGGGPLNTAGDEILERHGDLVERLLSFELVEGASSLFGSGDTAIVEIRLSYVAPSERELQDIEDIIAIARNSADDIEVEIIEIDA